MGLPVLPIPLDWRRVGSYVCQAYPGDVRSLSMVACYT
jgi:hypothetical protein